MKSLVVFYSRTGNTKFVAQTIAAQLGADIEEVIDQKKRAGPIGWLNAGGDATRGKETTISPTTRNPAEYDLLVIGTPVWAWRPTPAIRAYIAQKDLAGKKVAIFTTSDGDPKQAMERTKALLPNSTLAGELVLIQPQGNKEETENTLKQ